jgi:hypothetical protein
MSIQELKKTYEKVYVTHFRKLGKKLYPMSFLRQEKLCDLVEPVGGVVKVKIIHQGITKIGYSICDNRDNFNKREGNEKAIKNALLEHTPTIPDLFDKLFGRWFPKTSTEDNAALARNISKSKAKRLVEKDFHAMIE